MFNKQTRIFAQDICGELLNTRFGLLITADKISYEVIKKRKVNASQYVYNIHLYTNDVLIDESLKLTCTSAEEANVTGEYMVKYINSKIGA